MFGAENLQIRETRMSALLDAMPGVDATPRAEVATSCGTLILNTKGQLLLCHVTGALHWDIPKGMREPGESTFEAAKRELREETGLQFTDALFEEIGGFKYLKHKNLHLYKVRAPESLGRLDHLSCKSHFLQRDTGKLLPEMDSFCWAFRHDIMSLCLLPMAVIVLTYLMVTIGLLLSLCAQIPCRFSFFTLAGFWPMPHSQSLFSW